MQVINCEVLLSLQTTFRQHMHNLRSRDNVSYVSDIECREIMLSYV